MDPLSITAASVGLVTAVASITKQIKTFISEVRDSRKDMEAVLRELTSLTLCLETLEGDCAQVKYPEGFKHALTGVLKECDLIMKQMSALLTKLSSERLRHRIQWSLSGRDEMDKLRLTLEAHKSTIEITLGFGSIALTSAVQITAKEVKDDTALIRANMATIPSIKEDTSRIDDLFQEITALRIQVKNLEQRNVNGSLPLHRFLAESVAYTESIVDWQDLESRNISRETFGIASALEAYASTPEVDGTTLEALEVAPDIGNSASEAKNPAREVDGPATQIGTLALKAKGLTTTVELQGQPAFLQQRSPNPIEADKQVTPRFAAKTQASKNVRPPKSRKRKPASWQPPVPLDDQAIEAAARARERVLREDKLDRDLVEALERGAPKEEVKALLDRGADFAIGGRGSALWAAVISYKGTDDKVTLLLSRGANANQRGVWPQIVEFSTPECVKLLLDQGARAQGRSDGHDPPLHYALKNKITANGCDVAGLLLEYGADVNERDYRGLTALYKLTRADSVFSYVEWLLDHAADVNSGYRRWTPLHLAATRSASITELLLNRGADANVHDASGLTPLHAAAQHSAATTELLLDHGADINAKDFNGFTPLHFAARHLASISESITEMVFNQTASIGLNGFSEWTPPPYVNRYSSITTRTLLDHAADVNVKNVAGHTPLHYAARHSACISEWLLDRGAKINVKDEIGLTPLSHAAEYGQVDVCRILLDYGAKGPVRLPKNCEGWSKVSKLMQKSGIERRGIEMVHRFKIYAALFSESPASSTSSYGTMFNHLDWTKYI